jgi:hypothetical protein
MSQSSLRPQDVVVLAKLLSYEGKRPSIAQVGVDLALSASEVHAALKRLASSRLIANDVNDGRPLLESVEEFLVHGVKYAFPAQRGEVTRGMLTSYAAPPLNAEIAGSDLPPVWPSPEGAHRGVSLEPLYKTVPIAAGRDPFLYEILALLDALRDGRAREQRLAEEHLIVRLHRQAHARSKSPAS